MAENYKLQSANYKSPPDQLVLGILAAVVSIAAFVFYFRHNTILLYGDAVAHINIARRVFDSRHPGPLQLGTVWLPLPHILLLPFVISRWMWQTGVGGSIPSMLAYVGGALGIFRLVRQAVATVVARPLEPGSTARRLGPAATARLIAWLAALIYVANPNLLYLQATAMTEPLYLALFIWATVFFSEFVWQFRPDETGAAGSLWNCGIVLALAMLTRYDGWFAGAVFGMAAVAVFASRVAKTDTQASVAFGFALLPLPLAHRGLWRFLMILVAVPVLWVVYNAAVWGNPLEFATGQYSAKAIERRTASPTMPHHPGYHSVKVAAVYFLKDAKLELGEGNWQAVWMVLGLAGTAFVLLARRLWPLLLLWLPLPFYAVSISRGGVPIFLPEWWPFSYYNVRYGVQLMPAMIVFAALAVFAVVTYTRTRWRIAALVAAVAFVSASYISVWQSVPISLREAQRNSLARVPFERRLAAQLEQIPEDAAVLMFLGEHSGALQSAGIPLRRTINETTHTIWKQALADPAAHVNYAVAFGDDAVAQAVARQSAAFEKIGMIVSRDQRPAVIYRRR